MLVPEVRVCESDSDSESERERESGQGQRRGKERAEREGESVYIDYQTFMSTACQQEYFCVIL